MARRNSGKTGSDLISTEGAEKTQQVAKMENTESYEILNWIIQKAVPGLYLLCASPKMQEKIISHYKEGNIAVCDYREQEKHFCVKEIETWMKGNQEADASVPSQNATVHM